MFFSAFTRGTMTSLPHPMQRILKSIPERRTKKRFSPQGCCFFMVSTSPTRTSTVTHSLRRLSGQSFPDASLLHFTGLQRIRFVAIISDVLAHWQIILRLSRANLPTIMTPAAGAGQTGI
jgi:hypothetical protein